MPWKGLRFGGANQKGSSQKPLPPALCIPPSRLSEQTPRSLHSSDHTTPRGSDSLVLPNQFLSTSFDDGERYARRAPDRVLRAQNAKRNRFSLLRFRHASDPQLSASYQDAEPPPVPSIPSSAKTPKIITTSPTASEPDPLGRRRSIFKLSHKPRVEQLKSSDSTPFVHVSAPNTPFQGAVTAPSSVRASHISFDEPQGRLSTTSLRSGAARNHDGLHHGLLPAARLSESSRSETSSGELGGVYNTTSKTDASSSTSSFFRIPKFKKNRNPLFPIPKIPPGQSTGPDQRSRAVPDLAVGQDRELLSPLPSPSHSSPGRASPASGFPDGTLIRKNSTSAHSCKSSSSLKHVTRPGRRGRSSTIGSLPDIQDDINHSSLDYIPSSRTSTFTAPRKSFSDLFSPSQKSKQNIDGDNSSIVPGTPQSLTSKQNSFSIAREVANSPAREPDDTPATYLTRLEAVVHRAAIATVLSQSVDEFYKTTLRKYMRGFSFFGDAMDMSIRKLLMEAELPKETQQIDRVLQSFADRYHECNPGIFASTDQAYFIAFSLLILHTDVFNKNNKRKMQKSDYVRNTRDEGLAEEILECFYDNISYTPFIHVEDEVNLGVRRLAPKARSPLFKVGNSDRSVKSSRDPVDPYALILEGKLGVLRPNLGDVMDLEDIYSSSDPSYTPDMNRLHQAFYKPCVLQIVSERSRPDAFLTQSSIANPAEAQPGLVDIRVAKVGLLWRKDTKKKKTRSPWQEWGAVLTGSQLYFFKDVPWVKTLIAQYELRQKRGRRQPVTFTPPITDFKPDAVMSTADAVALIDPSYKKHKNAFLFVRHGGLEEVFLANSEPEMNDWMATINYAATFRTAGVRMRGMIGANYEGRPLQKRARPSSIASDTSESPTLSEASGVNTRRMDPQLAEEVFAARRELVTTRIHEANEKLSVAQKQLEDLLRNARHLQVLTPIHPRARDQVVLAAGRMAAKIKWARLDIWRTKCHRDVLASDLAEEEKNISVKKVPKSSSAAGDELSLTVSGDSPRIADSAPSLAPTSPKSNRSSRRIRSCSPTPIVDADPPSDLLENVPIISRRPKIVKSCSSNEIAVLQRDQSGSRNRDDPAFDALKVLSDTSLPRQSSVTSSMRRLDLTSSTRQVSLQRTPTPSVADTEEERLLREAGILSNELLSHMSAANEAADSTSSNNVDDRAEVSAAEGRGKVRRSLHRTLREGHFIPHHQRSRKGRDSGTTISLADEGNSTADTETLARGSGRFTLHGKKASVVTFGSEWENMSPEQRLQQRKPAHTEDPRASDILCLDSQAELPGVSEVMGVESACSTGPMTLTVPHDGTKAAAASAVNHSSAKSSPVSLECPAMHTDPTTTAKEKTPVDSGNTVVSVPATPKQEVDEATHPFSAEILSSHAKSQPTSHGSASPLAHTPIEQTLKA
ncbi:hypothetical protein LOZ65_005391 [Ophidiomyces ophidiicola]|nr:hypothetical protein LOZ65_005391 [Ophidiomyces ophidiicola]